MSDENIDTGSMRFPPMNFREEENEGNHLIRVAIRLIFLRIGI